jgi:hypothetical protein
MERVTGRNHEEDRLGGRSERGYLMCDRIGDNRGGYVDRARKGRIERVVRGLV